jgi:plasmid stabilization system protein ParE
VIVRLTQEAEDDLETIGDRIGQDDPARAASSVAELRGQCIGLDPFPERYPLVPRYEVHGIRRRLHGKYLIFYRVAGEEVVVLHVLHGAMDYESLLFPD